MECVEGQLDGVDAVAAFQSFLCTSPSPDRGFNIWSIGWNCFLSFVHNTGGHGKGSGKVLEEIVDIETADEEQTMVYS